MIEKRVADDAKDEDEKSQEVTPVARVVIENAGKGFILVLWSRYVTLKIGDNVNGRDLPLRAMIFHNAGLNVVDARQIRRDCWLKDVLSMKNETMSLSLSAMPSPSQICQISISRRVELILFAAHTAWVSCLVTNTSRVFPSLPPGLVSGLSHLLTVERSDYEVVDALTRGGNTLHSSALSYINLNLARAYANV